MASPKLTLPGEKKQRTTWDSFLGIFQQGGFLLVLATVTALGLANSPLHEWYHAFTHFPIHIEFGPLKLHWHLEHVVNDAFMTIFFLVVGLEIRREVLEGHLSSVKKASLPVVAAVGGMLVPAFVYIAMGQPEETANGWGVPMATDIAFAIAIIAALGRYVPLSLKVFLTALAIADDLGAILVIALFYSTGIEATYLWLMLGTWAGLYLGNRLGIGNLAFYGIGGAILWAFTYKSGIHATISGVLIAMVIPYKPKLSRKNFSEFLNEYLPVIGSKVVGNQLPTAAAIKAMNRADRLYHSLAERLERDLHSVVAYLIMPLFAFCNTGIHLDLSVAGKLLSPEAFGIIFGLWFGKPIGITLFSWLALRARLGAMPQGANWAKLFGTSILAGIGFTMSIFVSMLAFDAGPELQAVARLAILVGSFAAAISGFLFLRTTGVVPQEEPTPLEDPYLSTAKA